MKRINPKNLEDACETAARDAEKPEILEIMKIIKELDAGRKKKIQEINEQFEKECIEIWRKVSSRK